MRKMNQSFIKFTGRVIAFTNALVLFPIQVDLRAEEFIQIKGADQLRFEESLQLQVVISIYLRYELQCVAN
jgi:hypothetical protein